MRSKQILLSLLSMFVIQGFAQTFCDCDLIKSKKDFYGFCNEYLDCRLKSVKKEKAKFKMYVYYNKGKIPDIYPSYYYSIGAKRNTYNGKEIEKSDSIELLNGLIESYNRLGTRISTLFFMNGKITKCVNYDWGIFRPAKKVGIQVHEICEYYYPDDSIEIQIISYKYNGTIRYNVYASESIDRKWNFDHVTNLLTADPMKLNK